MRTADGRGKVHSITQDEGNLTGKTSIASPTVTWVYTWDVNNRMVAAVKSAGSNLYTVDYKYDVFGNRIEQAEDVDGAGGMASVTTRFAWEGAKVLQDAWGGRTAPVGTEDWNIWADLDGSNGLKVRYVRGDEVDQLYSRVKADGTVASYLTDRMGSVRQMVDASGTLANTITYDGFGNVLSETDAAFGDRWKWTGRESNSYTGLQYNRARYYSGEAGRWTSEDPIRFEAGDYVLARYIGNRINSLTDPSGLVSIQGIKYFGDIEIGSVPAILPGMWPTPVFGEGSTTMKLGEKKGPRPGKAPGHEPMYPNNKQIPLPKDWPIIIIVR